jgi:hypothetical protein
METVELTAHLVGMAPIERLEWHPMVPGPKIEATDLPTVFVPQEELLMTILLGNLEHLMNHKYQLFFYLKLLGIPVATQDLYKLRGASGRM